MKRVLVLLMCLGLCGCVPRFYNIRTGGFLDTTKGITELSTGASFAVLENKQAENPIFDKEVKSKIEKLLVREGCSIESIDKAKYFLVFYYAIDTGRAVTGAFPVYHPGGTTYQSGTFNVYGSSGGYGWGGYSGTNTAPGYTTFVPVSHIMYTRRLMLKVIDGDDYRNNRSEEIIWVGDTISSGSSSDLRDVIDYLLVATFKYFGQDTGKRMKVVLGAGDKEVKELRQ